MAWTQDLPTKTGWYWFKQYQQDGPRVVQVEIFAPNGVAILSPALVCRFIDALSGTELWDGPLQAPE